MKTTTKSTNVCRVCRVDINPLSDTRFLSAGVCFTCDFWMEKWQQRNDHRSIRIGGHHYREGREDAVYKAQGGQKFTIELPDGLFIITTNLWHQGRIPEQFRDLLPDNAKFAEAISV